MRKLGVVNDKKSQMKEGGAKGRERLREEGQMKLKEEDPLS